MIWKADVWIRQLSDSFTMVIRLPSTRFIKPNFHVSLSHRRSTTVSLETRNFLTSLQMFGQISKENEEEPWSQIYKRNNFQSFTQAIQVLFRYVAPLSVTCHADLSPGNTSSLDRPENAFNGKLQADVWPLTTKIAVFFNPVTPEGFPIDE